MHVLHLLNETVLTFKHIPSGFWQALLASGILSPLINVYKHFRFTKREIEAGKIAMFVAVTALAFGASVFQYLLSVHPNNPQVILLHTAVLGFLTQPVYLFAVKPLWKFLSERTGTSDLEKQLKTASIPAQGLPLSGTSVSTTTTPIKVIDDFSR